MSANEVSAGVSRCEGLLLQLHASNLRGALLAEPCRPACGEVTGLQGSLAPCVEAVLPGLTRSRGGGSRKYDVMPHVLHVT